MARMARPIVSIKDITDEKELWKIAVRIVDMWTVVNKAKEEHLEMVFMDAKGDKIHAIVPKEETRTWKAKLKEHNTYVFENFVVFKNDFLFKVCDHHYKMIFSDGTIFKENELLDIPPFQYHFKDFAEILSGNFRPDFLVDLIGAFHKLLSSHPEADPKRVVFVMKDISGNLVECTLWQETAMKFLNYYNERRHVRPIVMILTHARIKPAQGKYPASISNSFHGSKLLFDEEILEIQQFKKSLPVDEGNETSTQMVSQFTGGSQFSDHDRFMYNAQVKSIQEKNTLKQQSLSGTAEHDPDMLATITPAKRVSSEIQFDENPSQELATAQLSSTKVTKQIKTE